MKKKPIVAKLKNGSTITFENYGNSIPINSTFNELSIIDYAKEEERNLRIIMNLSIKQIMGEKLTKSEKKFLKSHKTGYEDR